MRTVKHTDVLRFIRVNAGSDLFRHYSNNFLRDWIHRCLDNKNFFFYFQGVNIRGIIEWYRYKNIDEIIWDFQWKKLGKYSGPILYVNYIICCPDFMCRRRWREFLKFQRRRGEITSIFRLQARDGFRIKELKGIRGI